MHSTDSSEHRCGNSNRGFDWLSNINNDTKGVSRSSPTLVLGRLQLRQVTNSSAPLLGSRNDAQARGGGGRSPKGVLQQRSVLLFCKDGNGVAC